MAYDIQDTLKEIQQQIQKPKRAYRKELPQRDPATKSVYDFLMGLKKPKGKSWHTWARNKVAFTLLRFLGLRVSDVATITLKQIQQGIQFGTFSIVQPKTGKVRVLVLTKAAKAQLEHIWLDGIEAFEGIIDKPLGSPAGRVQLMRQDEWIKTINEGLKPAVTHFQLKLTSHSFRANYITRLLSKVPIQNVRAIIGHQDIRTTDRYNRYIPNAMEVAPIIDEVLETSQKDPPSPVVHPNSVEKRMDLRERNINESRRDYGLSPNTTQKRC
jgi:integrase